MQKSTNLQQKWPFYLCVAVTHAHTYTHRKPSSLFLSTAALACFTERQGGHI